MPDASPESGKGARKHLDIDVGISDGETIGKPLTVAETNDPTAKQSNLPNNEKVSFDVWERVQRTKKQRSNNELSIDDIVHTISDAEMTEEQRLALAMSHRVTRACFKEEDGKRVYRSIWNTVPSDLGKYGVGVQLYFDYHKFVGILLFALFLLATPMLVMNLKGTLIDDHSSLEHESSFYKFVASMSLGNLGTCSMNDGCDVSVMPQLTGRKLWSGGTAVENVTEVLGILDGVGMLIFMLAALVFERRVIPKAKSDQDRSNITAGDFSVAVHGLPRRLPEDQHEQYEEILRQHFVQVLRRAHVPEVEAVNGVREVALVRNYNGAVAAFMEEGRLIREIERIEAQALQLEKDGKNDASEKSALQAQKLKNAVQQIEVKLAEHSKSKDEKRDVIQAFIMFNTEELKDKVLHKYRMSESSLMRPWQKQVYKFHQRTLRVHMAPEPTELLWENMDYPGRKRLLRKWGFRLLTLALLIIALGLAGRLTALPGGSTTFFGSREWIFEASSSCVSMCNVSISEDSKCSNFEVFTTAVSTCDYCGQTNQSNSSCPAPPVCNAVARNRAYVILQRKVKPTCWRLTLHQSQSWTNSFNLYACSSGSVPTQTTLNASWDPNTFCEKLATKPLASTSLSSFAMANNDYSSRTFRMNSAVSCNAEIPSLQKAQAAKVEAQADGTDFLDDSRLTCYCKEQYLKIGATFLLPPADTDAKKACKEWIDRTGVEKIRYFLGLSVTVVMNTVLYFVIVFFDMWSKYKNVGVLNTNSMLEIFVSQFVNTGFLVLLVSINTYGMFSEAGFLKDWLGDGPHDDFTTAWHTQMGASLVLTLLSTIASALFIQIFGALIVEPLFVWWFYKGATTQASLNEIYMLPEFAYASRLAASNNILFVTVMYAGAMPILYLIGAGYFLLAYWIDKWVLLKHSCKPPDYDHNPVYVSTILFPVAAVMHVAVTVCTFTPSIFPSDWSWLKGLVQSFFGVSNDDYRTVMEIWDNGSRDIRKLHYSEWVRARCTDIGRKSCWLLLCIAIVYGTYWFALIINRYFIRSCCSCCDVGIKEASRKAKKRLPSILRKESSQTKETYDEAKTICDKEDRVFSYKLSASNIYEDAYTALQYDAEHVEVTRKSKKHLTSKAMAAFGISTSPDTEASRKVDRKSIKDGIVITIIGAKDLRNVDLVGKSDPYCKCSVVGKPTLAFKTNHLEETLNPIWNYEHHMAGWKAGEDLQFTVYDREMTKGDKPIGTVELKSERFALSDFDGDLELEEHGVKGKGTLQIKVETIGGQVADL